MVWPRDKDGRGGYHREDVKHESAGREKRGEAKKIWQDNIMDGMK